MHQQRETLLQTALRILMKGIPRRGNLFKRNKTATLEVCIDTDYASSIVNRRSTIGYRIFLSGNLITWNSEKQSVVTRSSAKA